MPVKYPEHDDPLTLALAPPPDESPAQRADRLRAEHDAKRISDIIDEELNRQRIAERKGPRPVKVLLLGQSESGKSTTLKNFQLIHSPKAFRAELASWRAIVQLNVVRSIRIILDAVLDAASPPAPAPGDSRPAITPEHLKLRMRLLPLLHVEAVLLRRLAPGAGAGPAAGGAKELAVGAGSAWKSAFTRLRAGRGGSDASHGSQGSHADHAGHVLGEGEDAAAAEAEADPARVLEACGEDMVRLWGDPTVRALLKAQKLRLEEMPGFFLDSLERITREGYVPSNDDILRARLKTLGVTEYRFTMKTNNAVSHDWRVYDVGGQRSLRAAWVPFFDDMNAIIFLAPISCFDQVLAEDQTVNRLEDSVLLWRSIVANPLLARTALVLFLNKCDVLRAKLAAGIRLGKYVISYGERPNDFEHVAEYLRRKFAGIHRDQSRGQREFYCHFTSVTDTKATSVILEHVSDTVIRGHLQRTHLI